MTIKEANLIFEEAKTKSHSIECINENGTIAAYICFNDFNNVTIHEFFNGLKIKINECIIFCKSIKLL